MDSCADACPAVPPPPRDPALVRTSRRLVWLTLLWNAVEAVVAIGSGAVAGSVALIGFGLDSVIETSASFAALWRLRIEAQGASHRRIEAAEHRTHRFVGITFLVLAAWVAGQAAWTLWRRETPDESPVGIALAALSLVVMPLLAAWKIRLADRLGSAALRAEAKETLACALLSVPLLLGLALNAGLGWWWADPVAALAMVPWLVKEGRAGLRGEACC